MGAVEQYKKLKNNIKIKNSMPKAHYPSPTDEDYMKGIIVRYFVQRRDTPGSVIIEINSQRFNEYSGGVYYKTTTLKWRITGNLEDTYTNQGALIPSVIRSNQMAIKEAEKELPELNLYLVNPKQFYRGN
jgi:hypothetical protein